MTNLDPESAFPAEVLELRDQGIPLPTWYCGPLFRWTPELQERAMRELAAARAAAESS